jgi:hypothetical protein
MTVAHDVLPYVGRVTEVSDLTGARSLLGLGDTYGERHRHQLAGLKALISSGKSLKEAAAIQPLEKSHGVNPVLPYIPSFDNKLTHAFS